MDWLASCERAIAEAVEKNGRIALLFSGGIESCLLLHVAAPWRSQIKVYTVRTGAGLPHMASFIDGKLRGWDRRVIPVDVAKSFGEFGLPASAVPIEHIPGIAAQLNMEERLPRIVPWTFCCARNRWQPGCEAIKADGLGVAIHGQRAGDYPKATPSLLEYPGLTLVAPLWSVSREDVRQAVKSLSIELPGHYAEYASSLDCAVCPAGLTTKLRTWMARHSPEQLAVAEGLHEQVREAVLAALNGDNTQNAFQVK